MLGGELAVLQAPMFDGLSFDSLALVDDGFRPAEGGVGRRHVPQAFVVTPVIVVFDERLDLGFEIAGQEVVLQQYAVLHGLVPALDPRLREDRPCPASGDGTAHRAHGSYAGL